MVDERTSWRYFFCQAVSIMSSVKQAASAALQPNPTWAEAKPICQAAMISPEPSRNKLLSYPTVKLHRAAGQGQVTEMPPIPGAPEVKKRLKTGGNINHINLCRWRRWPAISQQQLYQTLFHAVINSQKKKRLHHEPLIPTWGRYFTVMKGVGCFSRYSIWTRWTSPTVRERKKKMIKDKICWNSVSQLNNRGLASIDMIRSRVWRLAFILPSVVSSQNEPHTRKGPYV